jgi:ABC-type multidrug transport system fused ATPase/permease subunit
VDINNKGLIYLALIAMCLILLRVHERYTSEKMSQKYINGIRSTLLKRLMRASVRSIQEKTIGNLSSRLAGDLSALKRWLSLGIARLVTHSILLILTMVLLFSINTTLGAVITTTVLVQIGLAVYVGNRLKYSLKEVRKNRIKIHSLLVERLSSMATIRAMGKEQQEVRKINRQANKLEDNIAKQGIMLGLLRGIGDASSLVLIAVFFSFQSFTQALSLEQITALISIILFLNTPIRELGRVQEYYQGAKLSIRKIQELFAIPRIIRGQSKQLKSHAANGSIRIKNISLEPIFKRLNFRARAGEHIALIGNNGAGKSSLIYLLLGLIKQDAGTIRINSINPRRMNSQSRSQNIGVCGANMRIIKGSLLENLTYRNTHYTQNEFDALIKFCQLTLLIKNLPNGLKTKVKENGSNFSSGEQARILLFRAMLGNPSLLILDEPESYLDTSGLELIKKTLNNYKGTVLIATHHSDLIKLCDKQWNLNKLVKNKRNTPIKLITNNESK